MGEAVQAARIHRGMPQIGPLDTQQAAGNVPDAATASSLLTPTNVGIGLAVAAALYILLKK